MRDDRPALTEIEITPEMIEAGAKVIDAIFWRIDPTAQPLGKYVTHEIAREVFRAMVRDD